MKRILAEVVLFLALVGAAVFGWMNWKSSAANVGQVAELTAQAEEAVKKVQAAEAALAEATKEIDPLKTELQGDDFIAHDTRLCFAGPGDVIDMAAGTVTRLAPVTASAAALDTLVAELIEECVGNPGPVTAPGVTHEAHIALRYRSDEDGTGHLDIESIRDRHG